MEKVWIRKGKPKRVLDKDDVHYFYWPWELGVGKIKIGIFRLPTFPLKRLDYEPIKVIDQNGQMQVISRFHYRILTYFNNPKPFNGRAVVDFGFGSHSPYIHSEALTLGSNMQVERMDVREIAATEALMALYKSIVMGKLKVDIDEINDYELEEDNVPQEAILLPSESIGVVWVGFYPVAEKTPTYVWEVLTGQKDCAK